MPQGTVTGMFVVTYAKASVPKAGGVSGYTIIESRWVHFLKALSPIEVTRVPMVSDVKDMQLKKA